MKKKPNTLTVTQVALLTGLRRRQVAVLARDGRIPDATRPDGWHYQYNDTLALRAWMSEYKKATALRRKPTQEKLSEGLRQELYSARNGRLSPLAWERRYRGLMKRGLVRKDRTLTEEGAALRAKLFPND